MPTRSAGLADVRERGGEALGEPVAALGDDLEAGAAASAPGSPSSDDDAPAGAASAAAAAERVGAAPRGAARPPAPGVHGGRSRVLTRPGTGALAITIRAGP